MKHFITTTALFLPLFLVLSSHQAHAYPDFIGYGYSSCVTCHFNGLGGGALNDYGRALFATEITARDVYSKNTDEEEIGAESGFLGSKPLPWWIRPGLKYRGLWLKEGLGTKKSVEQWINMENDVNLNFIFDKKQNFVLVTTTSYADAYSPHTEVKPWDWYLKEFYLRWKVDRNFWIYLGQLDKAYGIRTADHTAVSRGDIDMGQFSQSQGVIAHWTYPTWDIAAEAFFGNAYDTEAEKQKGGSVSGEYEVFERFKVGGSILSEESDQSKWNLAAVTSRMGLSKGSSVMLEAGVKDHTDKLQNNTRTIGTYALLESLILLRRGYNILSTVEEEKADINAGSAESLRWSFGAMMFPIPRTELRVMLVNGKTNLEDKGRDDDWSLQSQVHISY